eukprot:TRINITY_DN12635_c0_g1_i13.p2 TRINITY_DN12635_c0_g1~~TRINITY_DN12635_c0_g1_i13.p2  ORF type:complete len:144 (-),score=5.36 TRINITY_DN12635_c0_g1_i13:71-502(-)
MKFTQTNYHSDVVTFLGIFRRQNAHVEEDSDDLPSQQGGSSRNVGEDSDRADGIALNLGISKVTLVLGYRGMPSALLPHGLAATEDVAFSVALLWHCSVALAMMSMWRFRCYGFSDAAASQAMMSMWLFRCCGILHWCSLWRH